MICFPQHSILNDIIKHGLDTAGFLLQLELGNSLHNNFPFQGRKSLVWDAIYNDTFSELNVLVKLVIDPGSTSRQTGNHKLARYQLLSGRCLFIPITVKIFRVLGPQTSSLPD